MIAWLRRVRAALRAYDRLPTVGVGILDDRWNVVGVATYRVTVERGPSDQLVLVPADGGSVEWEADRRVAVVGIVREGRRHALRRPRNLAVGESLLVDRSWPIEEPRP